MLVINPEECIDCEACVPECPINAIYGDDEIPNEYESYLALNEGQWEGGTAITEATECLPGAKDLPAIQAEETAKGWEIEEPSASA